MVLAGALGQAGTGDLALASAREVVRAATGLELALGLGLEMKMGLSFGLNLGWRLRLDIQLMWA